MSYNNGIITKPVSISDVARALGSGSRDLGTLCRSQAIKIWAKFKPVKLNAFRELTRVGNVDENDFLRTNYGITVTTYSPSDLDDAAARNAIIDASLAGTAGWGYERPTGGNYPYRLLDFDGYNSNAICPFYFDRIGANYQLKIHVGQEKNLPTNNITIADCTAVIGYDSLDGTGYGVFYRIGGSSYVIEAFNDKGVAYYPLSQDCEIEIPVSDGAGDVDVVVFIQDYNRGWFCLLPQPGQTFKVELKPVQYLVEFSAWVDPGKSKWNYSFKITSKSSNVLSGTASIKAYKTPSDSSEPLYSNTYNVPAFTYVGQEYSQTYEGVELPADEIDHVTFTYKDTKVKTDITERV